MRIARKYRAVKFEFLQEAQSKKHKQMFKDQLKPLVNRVVVYNFGNQ